MTKQNFDRIQNGAKTQLLQMQIKNPYISSIYH